ncbi:DMT family transporter [Tropicimonas sp. S265A]|uniref:DMT family transporter n=1 Tax=Tropicimonas sp. S265A TaxID=3415134 RepID=UPI003C7D7AAD
MHSSAAPSGEVGRAALWMLGAITSFSVMAVAGRSLSATHDTFEIMMFRSLIGIGIVVGVAGAAGTLHQINRTHLRTHAARNVFHFTGQNLWFYAVAVAPLAQVIALEFTSPLWVTVLAPLFLGEKLTLKRGLAAIIGFGGVLLVAQPQASGFSAGLAAAAGSAICFAITAIFTKALTRTETITSILFWLTLIQAIFGVIAVGIDGQVTWPTLHTAPWLLAVAVAGLTAHFCLTSALRIAPAVIVMPMDFLRLPALALVGLAFYQEPLTWAIVGGSVLILTGNFINLGVFSARKLK